jgi:hypothetical protein
MTQLEAMALSVASEAVVAAVVARGLRFPPLRAALAAVVGTVVTHPLLWLAFPRVDDAIGYWTAVTILEAAVVVVESVGYRVALRCGWAAALLVSFVANAASTGLGLFIDWLGWA